VGSPITGTGNAISFGNQTAAGTYTVLATRTSTSCTRVMSGSGIVTINSADVPEAGNNGTLTLCTGDTPTNAQLLGALSGEDSGGSFTQSGNVYTYTVIGAGVCSTQSDTSTVTVNYTTAPNAGTDGTLELCIGTTPTTAQLRDALTGEDNGGTFTQTGNIYTYTVNGLGGCSGTTDTSTVTVIIIDSDKDGINDICDIDDDNDGILDTRESFTDLTDWTRGPGASRSKVITPIVGNTLSASSGNVGWNESYATPGVLSYGLDVNDVKVTFQAPRISYNIFMVGLNAFPNSNSSYSDINYAIYVHTSNIRIYESGAYRGIFGSIQSTDVLSVKKVGNTVTYLKNDVVFYTSLVAANETDYFVDTSVYRGSGNIIENIQISPASLLNDDIDNDGIVNRLDIDSDNDGIPDNIEAQTTLGFVAPLGIDADSDGLDARYDANDTNISAASNGLTPVNTDAAFDTSDLIPDYLDTNSDNDVFLDIEESRNPSISLALADADTDGLQNNFDTVILTTGTSSTNPNNNITSPISFFKADEYPGVELNYRKLPKDTDNDSVADYIDIDDDNDGILDTRESVLDLTDWTRGPGATVNKVVTPIVGNTLNANTSSLGWNESYASPRVLSYGLNINDFQVNFQSPRTSYNIFMVGLNALTNSNSSYTDIEYAIYINRTNFYIREKGTNRGLFGSFVSTDVFSIKKEGNVVNYLKNDVVFYTSLVPANAADYFVDTSVYRANGPMIQNIQIDSFLQLDTDGDGVPNHFDLDSDNDGIPDNVEAQSTLDYIISAADTDATYLVNDGINSAYIGGLTPVNTDGTGNEDYINLDADDDGVFDTLEVGLTIDTNNNGQTNGTVGENGIDNTLTSDNYTDVNAHINTPKTLPDADNDVLTFGDVDYRDTQASGIAMITQVHQTISSKVVEITNIHPTNSIGQGKIGVYLYKDTKGNQSGVTPSFTAVNSSEILPGASYLVPLDIEGADDTIIIAGTNSSTANLWNDRLDLVTDISNNSSYVRIDEILEPNKNFESTEWIKFVDDSLDPYRDLASGGPERHPHAPLLIEINEANRESNVALGTHRINPTYSKDGQWLNGQPDITRHVQIHENYSASEQFNARQISIVKGFRLTVRNSLLRILDDLTLDEKTSQIRLEGSSQLVQIHDAKSKVSGTGVLHVDQNSTIASIYRYNYMSSPVGGGSYTIGSVLKDGRSPTSATSLALDIDFISGVNGSSGKTIQIASHWLYTFASADGAYSNWVQTKEKGEIKSTDGFIMKGPGTEQNYTFVGTPNDGDLRTEIGAKQAYLLGNPYPSAINTKKFIEDNINSITGSLYFWQHAGEKDIISSNIAGHNYSGYIGGYATRNISMGLAASQVKSNIRAVTATIGAGTYIAPRAYIPIGQGFFVEGGSDGGPIVFNNSQREYKREGEESIFFKTENISSTNSFSNSLPIIKLGMNYTTIGNKEMHRQIGVSFNPNNSFDYDNGYDSELFDLSSSDMYWKFPNNDAKYIIAGVQEISNDLQVPLELVTEKDGEISIEIDEWNLEDQLVYLFDKLTNTSYPLHEQEAVLNLNTGVHSDRFFLTFTTKQKAVLSVEQDELSGDNVTIYYNSATKEININPNNDVRVLKVDLYSILGQKVNTWNFTDTFNDQIKLSTTSLASAVYLTKVTTNKGVFSKKLVVE
ncbi:T9SS type A sorting domain-containing protein, partial [uncultured Polaribacter sp.]|uniref:T9SS type A sorting domain-containing protein n=1 Tax=uncultured Polaribacter sp. TaxID=174711 RepID=UPI00260F6571